MAVSWNYLRSNSTTGLNTGQSWRVQAGVIANANDHNSINANGDVAGTLSYLSNLNGGWSSSFTTVPEPSTYAAVIGVLALGAAWIRRRRDHK